MSLTKSQQKKALEIVAGWLGPQMGYDGPAPTGTEAANSARGPVLTPDWDWPHKPTPAIILEGGPYDWAVMVAADEKVQAEMAKIGVFAEPWAGWALCLYREG